MCNKSPDIGVRQRGEKIESTSTWDGAGKCFEEKVSFALNEHEQELLKWTAGESETKHLSGAWEFKQTRSTWRISSPQLSDGWRRLSVLCPDSLGLFDHPWPLLTSVRFSCQRSTHRSFQDTSRREGGSWEFTGSGQPLAGAQLVPERRSLWQSQYRLWSIVYMQSSSVGSDWVGHFASSHILTQLSPPPPC